MEKEEKDIIAVKMANGDVVDMELVFHYQDIDAGKNYMIYMDPNVKKLYLASYRYNNNVFELDTDLTKEEIKKMEHIFSKYMEMV